MAEHTRGHRDGPEDWGRQCSVTLLPFLGAGSEVSSKGKVTYCRNDHQKIPEDGAH